MVYEVSWSVQNSGTAPETQPNVQRTNRGTLFSALHLAAELEQSDRRVRAIEGPNNLRLEREDILDFIATYAEKFVETPKGS